MALRSVARRSLGKGSSKARRGSGAGGGVVKAMQKTRELARARGLEEPANEGRGGARCVCVAVVIFGRDVFVMNWVYI
jgi:hypothetical protein